VIVVGVQGQSVGSLVADAGAVEDRRRLREDDERFCSTAANGSA